MGILQGSKRPPVYLLESESDLVSRLAMQAEYKDPLMAAMMFEEIDRAELFGLETLPVDAVRLGSMVTFVDERTQRMRTVELVMPAHANIAEGRISVLSLMGAALFGLRAGSSIEWPDIEGNERRIRIANVAQPSASVPSTEQ